MGEFKFLDVYCSQCGQGFGPGDNGFSHCESHAGKPPSSDWNTWQAALDTAQAEASAQAVAEVAAQAECLGRYLPDTEYPAEDLWVKILEARGKCQEALECFLDLSERAWELVEAERQRAKEKSE